MEAVRRERARQDTKWGGSEHDDTHTYEEWCNFIRERLPPELHEDAPEVHVKEEERIKNMRQIAALAMACLESEARYTVQRSLFP